MRTITMKFAVALLLCCGLSTTSAIAAKEKKAQKGKITYYVDSASGRDSANGTSPETPFKTLNKINSITLRPGTSVYLKKGSVYNAQKLEPKGSGTADAPIVIGSYGEGDEKPIINGNGAAYALLLENTSYMTVCDLTITNTGQQDYRGRRGVIIRAQDQVVKSVAIKNLTIKDVNGVLAKSAGNGGGIVVEAHSKDGCTRFDGMTIEGCHILNCQRNGINFRGYINRDDWQPSTNVVIRSNLIENVPGDQIVPIMCDGAIIEHNIVRHAPRTLPISDAAAGIWPWSCDNTIVRYNVAQGMKAYWDGQGYDSDFNCTGTIIENNVSLDNDGGFLLVCCNGKSKGMSTNIGNKGTIFRHNISINDGVRDVPCRNKSYYSPIFHIGGPVDDTTIEENLVVINKEKASPINKTLISIKVWDNASSHTNTLFKDNIFYLHEPHVIKYEPERLEKLKFSGNKYYGEIPSAPAGLEKQSGEFNMALINELERLINTMEIDLNSVHIDMKDAIDRVIEQYF